MGTRPWIKVISLCKYVHAVVRCSSLSLDIRAAPSLLPSLTGSTEYETHRTLVHLLFKACETMAPIASRESVKKLFAARCAIQRRGLSRSRTRGTFDVADNIQRFVYKCTIQVFWVWWATWPGFVQIGHSQHVFRDFVALLCEQDAFLLLIHLQQQSPNPTHA